MSDERIIRLLAIARGLEDDGQYNVAKLFRAAAAGEGVRQSRQRPRLGAGLAEAMEAAIADLRAAGYAPAFLSTMERGASAALAGDWIALTDAPRPFVCRECGAVFVAPEPRDCAACGARALSLLEIEANPYLEPLAIDEIAPALARGLADVEASTAGVSGADAERGPWPMREIVAHLLASERLLSERARRMLREDDPLLVSVSPDEITAGVATVEPTLAGLVSGYVAARRATLDTVAALTPADWQRTGYHPEWGRVTVQQQVGYIARHEAGHLGELAARRAGR